MCGIGALNVMPFLNILVVLDCLNIIGEYVMRPLLWVVSGVYFICDRGEVVSAICQSYFIRG